MKSNVQPLERPKVPLKQRVLGRALALAGRKHQDQGLVRVGQRFAAGADSQKNPAASSDQPNARLPDSKASSPAPSE